MTEKMLCKARKREKRFHFFLRAAAVVHGLAFVMLFLAIQVGSIRWFGGASVVLFFAGALLSGLAGLNANFFWGVTESVIVSKEKQEELLEMCAELE